MNSCRYLFLLWPRIAVINNVKLKEMVLDPKIHIFRQSE